MDEQNPDVSPWFLFLEMEKGKLCKCISSSSISFSGFNDLQHVALEHVCLWFWVNIMYMNILWICWLHPIPQAISSFLSTMTRFFWILFVCLFVWTRCLSRKGVHQKSPFSINGALKGLLMSVHQKISWIWKKVMPLEQSVTLQQINSRAAAPWVDRPGMVFLGQRWLFLCQDMAEPNPGVFPWFLILEIEKGKLCKCSPSWSTPLFLSEWSSACCARASLSPNLSGHNLHE